MRYVLRRNNRYVAAAALLMLFISGVRADSVPSGFRHPLEWHVGAEVSPSFVPGSNGFLNGNNPYGKRVDKALSGSLKADFSFSGDSREGMLYKGLYQGTGIGFNSFFADCLLGIPVTAYVYQGAPIVHFTPRLWLGYEWKFGAAFGWKHYDKEEAPDNIAVSTSVTAMMQLGFSLHYSLSDRLTLSIGVEGTHFSNGNTSLPNSGVNSLGPSLGLTYVINHMPEGGPASSELLEEADRRKWLYDLMVYGAWRRRVVYVGEPSELELCPGKFGVVGMQFSPMCHLNRWVAVGPALDAQWDESAGLEPYWIAGSYDENLKFRRPPFAKQLSIGISAHAELTTPIFSVNAGVGYDMLSPVGNKRFYQSLALKTFITDKFFLNVGYRLGNFSDPQNLMLGIGVRL